MFEKNQEANINILKLIYSKRKVFIIVAILSIIAAVVVTMLTPKIYKSTGTVYPVNSNAYNDIIYNPTFGNEMAADRLIQLFESNFVKDRIVKKFDLIKYYELDTNDPTWQYYLNANYSNDITFKRTQYLSVQIEVHSKKPELSANIVNELINIIDSEREKILKTNVKMIVENYQKEYELKNNRVNELLDSIYSLSGSGYGSNKNPLFQNRNMFMEERQKNTHIYPGDAAIKKISAQNQTMEVEKLINEYYFMQGRLNFIRGKLDEAQTRLNLPIASVYKISWAKPNYKKVSPKLSVNGIIFLLGGFILTLLFLLIRDQFAQIKNDID